MTLGIVAKLAKGQYSLDISSGRYAVVEFIPPTAAEVQETAPGLSSNRYGGGALTNRRGINGGLVITVRVMGASQAEVERGVEDVIAFSRLSGDEAEPLYLEWLPNNYVPYKPLWGQSGWKRIDIKTAVRHIQRRPGAWCCSNCDFDRRNRAVSVRVEPTISDGGRRHF